MTDTLPLCCFSDMLCHRREGILVLSGGLLVHNLRDFSSFSESTANSLVKSFNQAILEALTITDVRTVPAAYRVD